jgi:serine/threonine protein kinase/WD40 repeat protein
MSNDKATNAERASEANRRVHETETVIQGLWVQVDGGSSAMSGLPEPEPAANIGEFSRALIDLGLIEAEDLETFVDASKDGVLSLSRALVNAGRLTPYQAAAIYRKQSRGLLIGNYLILDKLGQGGMGVVFKARHRVLSRVGALKILPPSFARDRDAVMRFRREVEAAGRLKHANVVAAFDADEDRGVHFLVMDYVEGRDLDRVVRECGPMQVAQAIDCVIQAARGLEAAHAQGIVHRDIKPGNLMLESSGTVRVLDLGLARIVDAANPFGKSTTGRLTQSGTYMGTVDYMAPEQAEDSHRVDHRADIYSLGCTLYYLLTGKEPFQGDIILRRLMAHMERPAPSLCLARGDVPSALDAAYLKMMAKMPDDRPASMAAVISLLEECKKAAASARATAAAPESKPELMVFNEAPLKRANPPKSKAEPLIVARQEEHQGLLIDHELNLEDLVMDVRSEAPAVPRTTVARPLQRPVPPTFRAASRHKRTAFLALGASMLVLAVAIGIVVSRPRHADADGSPPPSVSSADSGGTIRPAKPTAPVSPEPVRKTIFDGTSRQGWMLCSQAPVSPQNLQPDGLNPHRSGSYLVAYEQKLGDFVLEFEYKLTKGCNTGVFLRVSDLNDPINSGIEAAIDDTTRDDDRDSGGFYGMEAPKAHTQKPAGEWNQMKITAQGPHLAISLNGIETASIEVDSWVEPGKRPDGANHRFERRTVAQMARAGYLGFQDLGGDCWFRNIVLTTAWGGRNPSSSSFAAGQNTLGQTQRAGTAGEPYVETARFIGHSSGLVEQVRLLPDRKTQLTASQDKTVRLWDLKTGRELRRLRHPAGVRGAVVLPDGRRAVTGCNDGYVRLWDLQTGQEIRRLVKHASAVLAIAVGADGRKVVSVGDEPFLRVSDLDSGHEVRQVEGQEPGVFGLAIARNGQRLLSASGDGIFRLVDLKSSAPLAPLERHSRFAFSVAFTPDDRHAVSSCIGQMISWDLATKKAVRQTNLQEHQVASFGLAESHHAVFCSHGKEDNDGVLNEGLIGTWNFDSNDPPRIIHRRPAHLSLALLPDGAVATGDVDGLARIWEPSRSIARARELVVAGKADDALAEYGKAVTRRPDDARLLIERGRLLAEQARASEADADFTSRAARHPPNWAGGKNLSRHSIGRGPSSRGVTRRVPPC